VPQVLCPAIVGREAERSVLRDALAGAMAGEGQCVLLVGEPGIGKSRLAREVAGWAADAGVPVVTGRAVPSSGSAGYRPITEALSQLLRRWPVPVEEPRLDPWLALLQPLVPAFVDRWGTAEAPASLRAEAVLQLVRCTVRAGLVVVLEDLHWADPDPVALVEYLADNLADMPMLLVLTLRDSQISPSLDRARRQRGRSRTTYLELDRLDQEQAAAMVRACDPDAATDAVARIEQASEGVPLLIEELLASPGLPADFAATVKARLAALPRHQREVIEAAAVLGRRFDWELLPAITGASEHAVAEGLSAGIESLLLTSHGGELRFRHALTQEAVLDTLLPPRQRQLAGLALATLSARPELDDGRRELAVDLALRAGR
jgi:predicted ATPase